MLVQVLYPFLARMAGGRRERHEERAKRLRDQQEEALLEKVRVNAESLFGRRHHFDEIRRVEDFRRWVPLSTYEYVQPYVEKVMQGDTRALFGPREKVRFLAMTSGTTQRAKYLPITERFARELRLGWWIWMNQVDRDYPGVFRKRGLLIGSPLREKSRGGIPSGCTNSFLSSLLPKFARDRYALPESAAHVQDGPTKFYVAVRLGATNDVSILCTPLPGTILLLAKAAAEHHEILIRDVRDGTISFFVPPEEELVRDLRRRVKPDPRAARRLEAIRDRRGKLLPTDLWPNLRVLACWKGGPLQNYLGGLAEHFGELPVRDIGLVASEGRMTIPMTSEGSAGMLDLTGNFYEFIPIEEAQSDSPTTLLAHEVEVGKSYLIVLTTSGGLYRYNINDVVRVVGFRHQAPVLEFENKGAGIVSIMGEKLAEVQVVRAAAEASTPSGRPIETLTVVPQWGDPPFYAILVEEGAIQGQSEGEFAGRFDAALQRLNIQYEAERKLSRLGRACLWTVPRGTWDRYRDARIRQRGTALEQYKHVYLEKDPGFLEKLEGAIGPMTLRKVSSASARSN